MLILYFAGDLKDTSGTYTTCFYLFGSTHLISSDVRFFWIIVMMRREIHEFIFYIVHLYVYDRE